MNEMALLHVFKEYCKPLLCYGLECCSLTASDKSRISFAWNSLFWKLFLVKNNNSCINDMFVYTGCLPMLVDLDIRKYTFLCKLLSSGNFVLNKLYHMFGAKELNHLSDAYNVKVEHSFLNFRAILRNCYFNFA